MGLMRWMRGSDDDASATAVISAGLAEIDGLFRPSKHKQTEHVEASKRRRVDVANGAGVDLDTGVAVVRAKPDEPDDVTRPARSPRAARTPYQPRRRTWWTRMRMSMRRRRRARRDAGTGSGTV
jgi:hypothetical protein